MNLDDFDPVEDLPAPPRRDIPPADRQLLELAAHALGAVRTEEVDGEGYLNLYLEDGSVIYAWNSLVHSDDAFNLLVTLAVRKGGIALMLNSRLDQTGFASVYTDERHVGSQEYMGDDPSAATRRAATRAAAEIGKSLRQHDLNSTT